MAKKIRQIMKSGFVVLNINTNENTYASILNGAEPENTTVDQSSNVGSRSNSSMGSKSSLTNQIPGENPGILPISLAELSILLDVDFSKINTIDLQGSRLYGTLNTESDWDIVVIGDIPNYIPGALKIKNKYIFKEVITSNGNKIQANIFSISDFNKTLEDHYLPSLEVIFHPDNFKILNKTNYSQKIDNAKLIESALNESEFQWVKAKEIIDAGELDVYLALKRIWHSYRYLIFTEQILKYGKIIDFSAANYLYMDIINNRFGLESKTIDFSYIKENYMPLRLELEAKIKNFLLNTNANTLPNIATNSVLVGGSGVSGGGAIVVDSGSGVSGGGAIVVDSGSGVGGGAIVVDGGSGIGESIVLGGDSIVLGGSGVVVLGG